MKSLLKDTHFEQVATHLVPDAKKRLTLGKALAAFSAADLSFTVYQNKFGQIVLDPQQSVPLSEAWLFKNPKALASVKRGLEQSAKGQTRYLGSFAKHANE